MKKMNLSKMTLSKGFQRKHDLGFTGLCMWIKVAHEEDKTL